MIVNKKVVKLNSLLRFQTNIIHGFTFYWTKENPTYVIGRVSSAYVIGRVSSDELLPRGKFFVKLILE